MGIRTDLIEHRKVLYRIRKDLDMLNGFSNMDTLESMASVDLALTSILANLKTAIQSEKQSVGTR